MSRFNTSNMDLEEVKKSITNLASQHLQELESEFAFMYEIEAYELILAYLIENDIKLGEYNLSRLFNREDEYEENYADVMAEIQSEVLSANTPFDIHPDALDLYAFHKKAFWPGS